MANQIVVEISQVSAATSEAAIRQHRVLIDRPEAKGGSDRGPMGGELFLASIGGCFMSNLLAAMKARKLELPGLQTRVTGTLAENAPMRFTTVELLVAADSPDQEAFEHLVEIADKGCIMMNTLRGKLDVLVVIGHAATSRVSSVAEQRA
jgi:putative redox protein